MVLCEEPDGLERTRESCIVRRELVSLGLSSVAQNDASPVIETLNRLSHGIPDGGEVLWRSGSEEHREEEVSSNFLHADFTQLVVIAYRHSTVLQSTDIRNDGWAEPTAGVFVGLILVEVNLVPNCQLQMLSSHCGPRVHGSAETGRGGSLNNGLDTDFTKTVRVPYEPWEGLLRAVGFGDLVDAARSA